MSIVVRVRRILATRSELIVGPFSSFNEANKWVSSVNEHPIVAYSQLLWSPDDPELGKAVDALKPPLTQEELDELDDQ